MQAEKWGEESELWNMDLRNCDLGFVEDKIERAVREAYMKYLLLDAKSRKLMVVLPSVMPHQLLSTVLGTLFSNFQTPNITLLSPAILTTSAAGCRSALIVDVGWSETIVTGVYEYRELYQSRTTRAMRMATLEMAKIMEKYDAMSKRETPARAAEQEREEQNTKLSVELDQAEEVTTRMVWCKSRQEAMQGTSASNDTSDQLGQVSIANDETASSAPADDTKSATTNDISIPSPSSPRRSILIPFPQFAEPAEKTFLAKNSQKYDLDDHEQPLHHLIFKSLLRLPPDVRSVCMSRIIVTGGGSNIPGLKTRLLDEVSALKEQRGWDAVEGKAADERRKRLKEISHNRQKPPDASSKATDLPPALPASQTPLPPDPIEEKLRRDQNRGVKSTVSGVIRGVETLGAWAGASLLTNLRIKGLVEIERDTFLQYGLAGARRDMESNVGHRKSMGGGVATLTTVDKGVSGLGIWA
jgi:actin-related protein